MTDRIESRAQYDDAAAVLARLIRMRTLLNEMDMERLKLNFTGWADLEELSDALSSVEFNIRELEEQLAIYDEDPVEEWGTARRRAAFGGA